MAKLLHQLQTEPFTLLVSLPRNDVKLAQAALQGGAKGLKIHINVEHFASGTKFGSFDEEHDNILKIVDVASDFDASVGIVPGGFPFATSEEFGELAALGIDYFDAYPADAPPWTMHQKDLDVMLAAFAGSSLAQMKMMQDLGMQMCEASILSHDEYGRDLSVYDIARYHELADALDVPIIVPSQKKIAPRDISCLKHAGAKALLIGAIVTGREAQSVESAVRAFAEEIAKS
jgi:hypothetical protein